MRNAAVTMDDIDSLRDFIDGENQAAPKKFVIVLPPSMMVDLANEADRTAITKVTRDADGATNYEVVEMREGVEVTAEVFGFISTLVQCRFIETPRLGPFVPRQSRHDPAQNMDHLRKVTGQDWRGRR